MRKLPIFLVLCISMISCINEKMARKRFPCPSDVSFIVKRDTVEKLKIVETVIPADSGWIKALIVCDSSGKAYIRQIEELKNGRKTKPFIRITPNNELIAGAIVDSQAVYTAFKERYIRESSEKIVQLPAKEIRYVPGVIKFLAWSGGAAWAVVVLIVVIQVFKISRKLWPI